VMDQAVQYSRGDGGVVVKDARPVFVRLIGGDDGGTLFVTAADDLEEEVSAGLVDRQIAQFVEDQQRGREELLEFTFKPALGLGGAQGVDGLDRGGKEHRVTLETGRMAQGGGQMGFTDHAAPGMMGIMPGTGLCRAV